MCILNSIMQYLSVKLYWIEMIRSGTISSSGEVVVALIGLMLQRLMDRMNGIIAPQEIMRRVTAQGNAAGIRLGEVRSVELVVYNW